MPDELADLYAVADGGHLLVGSGVYFPSVDPNSEPDRPRHVPDGPPMIYATRNARQMLPDGHSFHGNVEYRPQPDVVALCGPGQYGLWLEVSGPYAGSVLYYRVLALDWSICRAAPSIENLFRANLEVTRIAGHFAYEQATATVFDRYGIDPRAFR